MNVNTYLPDHLVRALDHVAAASGSSRSAVMREAVELYLRRRQPGAWPNEVAGWAGDAEFPPFESLRGEAERSVDPFEMPTPN
ncbi:MAG: ribbon-helix-helix protein, CopG family [Lautropia sp.]